MSGGLLRRLEMTVVYKRHIKVDDPLGYPEKDLAARLRHMAEDALNGVNEELVAKEAERFRQLLREAGYLPRKTE